jgi:hypothetical protein
MNRLSIMCGLALLGAIVVAVAAGPMDQKSGAGMFGLFGGKKAAISAASVAPEVGSALQTQSTAPSTLTAIATPSESHCRVLQLRGQPPEGTWTDEAVAGETRSVFVVPAAHGQPPLALVSDSKARMHIWELSEDPSPRFVRQRPVALGEGQASWLMYFPVAVSCLPGDQFAIAISYTSPAMKEALYIYSRSANEFRRIDVIEPEMSGPPPFSSFETLTATPNAKLLNFRTEVIRLGAGNYVYRHNHILLFSSRFPNGLEVVKLGIDDGNLRQWTMVEKTLWLRTQDKRKPVPDKLWSLDLSKVL